MVAQFPIQVVTKWLGNTPAIAMKHYLMVTDEHFEAAIHWTGAIAEAGVQNPAQQGAARR